MEKTLRFIGIVDDKMTFVVGDGTARNFNYAIHVKASPGSQLTIHYDDGITSNGTDHIEDEVMNCDGTLQTHSRRIYLPYAIKNITISGSAVRNMNTLRFDGGGYLQNMPVYGSYFTLNRSLEELQLSGMIENAHRSWSPLWNGMPNLKRLILRETPLSGIDFTASNGSRPQKLEILDLSYTKIRNVDVSGLSGLISANFKNMKRDDYNTEPLAVDSLNASGCPNLKYIDLYNDSSSTYCYKWGFINLENDTSLLTANIRYDRYLEELNIKGCINIKELRLNHVGDMRYDKSSLSSTPFNIKYDGNISLLTAYFEYVGYSTSNLPSYDKAINLEHISINDDNNLNVSGPIVTLDVSRYSKLSGIILNSHNIEKIISYNNPSLCGIIHYSSTQYPTDVDIQNNVNFQSLTYTGGNNSSYLSGYLDSVTLINNPKLNTVILPYAGLQSKFNIKQTPSLYTFRSNNSHIVGDIVLSGIGKVSNNPSIRMDSSNTLTAIRLFDSNVYQIEASNCPSLTDIEFHGSFRNSLSLTFNNSPITGYWLSGNAIETNAMNSFLNSSRLPIVQSGIIDFSGNLSGYAPTYSAVLNAQLKGWTVLY